ncbi:unnamed protein product [Brassica napus]|uniref:(rape) hypothetical protein n=1 Tax=Brassica napus TaxID=3708 RepID=A0A816L459_BRANA|nr:unnamed protein product [Brassica napus]
MSPLHAWRRLSQSEERFSTRRPSTTIISAFDQIPKSSFGLSTGGNERLSSTAFSPISTP